MAARRSGHFDPHISPDLLAAAEAVAADYAPYDVQFNSGYRPNASLKGSQHKTGNALDFQLFDKKTGAALPNIRSGASAPAYQAYAQEVYKWAQQHKPELAERMRWGGYFSGGAVPMDLMHLDLGGGPGGLGMGGGSWDKGFTPEMMDTWDIAGAGGLGGGPAADAWKQAFLASIAQGESPGYDVMYGGQKFTDFSRHPHQAQTAGGVTSDAAGRYQFLGSTWDEQQKKYGYKDFSQESQDLAAWNYAHDIYSQKTGGADLAEALQSGDAARINAAANILNQTWSSLPGGKEQSHGYGGKTFYDVYKGYLDKAGQSTGTEATPAKPQQGPPAPAADDKPPWAAPGEGESRNWLEELGKGVKAVDFPNQQTPAMPAVPQAAIADAPAGGPPIVPKDPNRMALAQLMMQRLNTGKLF
jgi:muramidase (phage lysozyme)